MTGAVVVTGATGFVGRHLVPAMLDAGQRVAVIRRPASDLTVLGAAACAVDTVVDTGDVRALRAALTELAPTTLVHLATHYVNVAQDQHIAGLYESNVVFGGRVVHAFTAAGGRGVVYTSTFSQQAAGAGYDPTNLYAATKQAFADVLRHYARNAGVGVLDLELFDTFGPGDPRTKIWTLLVEAARTGTPLDTTPGDQLLNPVHVRDVVAALLRSVQLGAELGAGYHRFSAPGPQVLSLREAAALLARVAGTEIPVRWGARGYGGNEVFEFAPAAARLPGWSPHVSLEQGFAELWRDATSSVATGRVAG